MSKMITRRTVLATAASAAVVPALPVFADDTATSEGPKTIEVLMLNKHPENKKKRYVFHPRVVSANVGDTIVFKAEDRGHNSEAIKDMIPDGAERWNGKINKEIEVVVEAPGFYGYKCTPHATVGMVGLIVVEGEGKLNNLEAAQKVKQRGKTKKEWEEIWEEAAEMGLMEETTA